MCRRPSTTAPNVRDWQNMRACGACSPRPKRRAVRSVTADASERVTQSSIMRGCVKMLTAAMASSPSVPTMMMSTELRSTMKTPSNADGIATRRYILSYPAKNRMAFLLSRSMHILRCPKPQGKDTITLVHEGTPTEGCKEKLLLGRSIHVETHPAPGSAA